MTYPTMSPDELWWQEIAAAARAERAAGSRVAEDLRTLVEVAEVLAGTPARTMLGRTPELANVTATIMPNRSQRSGFLSARPTVAPTFPWRGTCTRA
jgi:hypothetical protein